MTGALEPRRDLLKASILPPTAPSAAIARRRLLPLLEGLFSPEQQEVAELLVSELVTNAVLYTDAPIIFSATVSRRCLRVEVRDASSALPEAREPEGSNGGWGLYLVNRLASRWEPSPSTAGSGCGSSSTAPRPRGSGRNEERSGALTAAARDG